MQSAFSLVQFVYSSRSLPSISINRRNKCRSGNGIDDDNNGYVDDVYGYDFMENDPDPCGEGGCHSHQSGIYGPVGGG